MQEGGLKIMKEIVITKLATFVLGLLNTITPVNSDNVVHMQGSNVSIAIIDFNSNQYKSIHFQNKKRVYSSQKWFYDLASLTKPLTMGATYISSPELFSDEDKLLLNHKGGLPPTFVVNSNPSEWKNKIESFEIKDSLTKYSDTSAVRLMMNLKSEHENLQFPLYFNNWLDSEVVYWRNIPHGVFCPSTGKRNGLAIHCSVHDNKAFQIQEFVSHAGFFATVDGVAKTLLNLNNKFNLNSKMAERLINYKEQFLNGWEVNKNFELKSAGENDYKIFGHRGYTGTSIWVNTDLNIGVVILTNTSSLENSKNRKIIAKAKHQFREMITTYVWNLFKQ